MRHLIAAGVLVSALLQTLSGTRAQSAAAPPLPAQSASSRGTADAAAGGLEGTVTNAQTGEPVKKAEVTAFWVGGGTDTADHDPISVATDGNGRFSISGLAAGKYRVRTEANRFAAQAYGEHRPGSRGKDVTLAPGQQLHDLEFRLLPCGVITGEVHDEDGDAVEGALVQAVPVGRNRGFQGGNQVQTNDLGQYRLYNLTPGQYVLQVALQRSEAENPASQETYVPIFYPDATDPGQAVPITVESGSETQGIDVDLRRVHAVRVRGRVVNEAGARKVQNAYVMLMPSGADPRKRSGAIAMLAASRYGVNVANDQGDFEISGVPAGAYWATATLSLQDDDRQYQGRVALQVGDSDVQGLTIPVSPGVTMTGRVRVEPERSFDFTKLVVAVIPADPMTSGGQGAQAKTDGSFVVENLSAGTYRVAVSGYPEEYYLKSVRLGGGDVLETGLNVDSNSRSAPIEIVLSSGGVKVSGAVLKDHQPAQATVFLVPDAPRRDRQDLYSVKRTKPDGSFVMMGLPPGDFKLFAFEDPDPGLMSDPSLLQPYEAQGHSVHIEEGQNQTVQLDLIPAQE